jgi:replicative DNA helicase
MSVIAEPQNLDAESSVLGAILLSHTTLPAVVGSGVRPEHFYRPTHGLIYAAMLELHDAGRGIDLLTLTEHLRSTGRLEDIGGKAKVELLAGSVPDVGNLRDYARIVVEKAHDRSMRSAAYELIAAIDGGDDDRRHAAMASLAAPKTERVVSTSTAEQLATRAFQRYSESESDLELFPLPEIGGRTPRGDDRLNEMLAGGLRPGEYVGCGGHTGHGKSVLTDQWLEVQTGRGCESRLYLTEMTEDERVDRIVSRLSGVSLSNIRWRRWNDRHRSAALRALEQFAALPFSITSAHDWTVEEIRLHLDFSSVQAVAVDTLHDIARPPTMGEEPGLRHISSQLRAAAKSKGRERALWAVIHLNDVRNDKDYPPIPVNRDIRGTGMIIRHLDTCVMVWQHPDDDGSPGGEGILRVTKARSGEVGQVPAFFSGSRVRWMPSAGEGS